MMGKYITDKSLAIAAMTAICLAAIFFLDSTEAKEIALTALGAIGGFTINSMIKEKAK